MQIAEVEKAQKLTTEALKWSPIQFAAKKKELEKTNTLADQVLDKKFEELNIGVPAEVVSLRAEAKQLFEKAAKMFKVEPAKEACAKLLESWEHSLKALEAAAKA
jgi:hypothetical protein